MSRSGRGLMEAPGLPWRRAGGGGPSPPAGRVPAILDGRQVLGPVALWRFSWVNQPSACPPLTRFRPAALTAEVHRHRHSASCGVAIRGCKGVVW